MNKKLETASSLLGLETEAFRKWHTKEKSKYPDMLSWWLALQETFSLYKIHQNIQYQVLASVTAFKIHQEVGIKGQLQIC